MEYLRDAHLEDPDSRGEPECTRAQMIRYMGAEGQRFVEVFQYLRPDGTLGGRGKPDPKRLSLDGVMYAFNSRVLL